jgi:predicted exporter
LFQNSPLSNKLFIVVSSESKDETQKTADFIYERMLENKELSLSARKTDRDFLLSYYYNIPEIFNETSQKYLEAFLNNENVAQRINENIKLLYSAEGMFAQDFIVADPIGILPIFTNYLKVLDIGNAFDVNNGYITSKDGKNILLIFNCLKNFLDSSISLKIDKTIKDVKNKLPEKSELFYIGAPRYTVENREIIYSDMKKIFIVSAVFIALMFAFLLRDKKALIIYLAPPVTIVFAATATFLFFKTISGLTIGFGSVLMGLSVDYSVYMYFALKSAKEEDRFSAAKKMFAPISISAVSSIAVFAVLFFSNITVFKQISLFCAFGLSGALFLALFVAPFIFDCKDKKIERILKTVSKIKTFYAVILVFTIIVLGAIGLKYVKFDASLESLSAASKQFERDKEKFEKFAGNSYSGGEMLFVFGGSKEEAFENNEKFSLENPGTLKLAQIFPSEKTKKDNIVRWKEFWNSQRTENIKVKMSDALKKYGIELDIFNNFFRFIESGEPPLKEKFKMTDIFEPLIHLDNEYAFVNILPGGGQIREDTLKSPAALLISNEILKKKIVSDVTAAFIGIMPPLIVCSLIILTVLMRSFIKAALILLSPICGVFAFFIMAAILSIKVNLFGIFAIPLIFGLGIDYGIFIVFQTETSGSLHPTKAVVVAALSTLISFGSLMIANHPVLFNIGFIIFVGVMASLLISVYILPPLLRNIKRISLAAVIFLFFLFGCNNVNKINYNVSCPGNFINAADSKKKIFNYYGVYRDNLQFRAVAVYEGDGYRIVVLNDFGVRFLDMKIKKNGSCDIYFSISYIPKKSIIDFVLFFKEYFYNSESKNIRKLKDRYYYYNKEKSVLWLKQM